MLNAFAKFTGKAKGEVYIYEQIGEGWFGGITAKSFMEMMKPIASVAELDIYINSPGGNVFDGIAIGNQITRHPASRKTVHIDGIAASIASVIAMSGSEIKIASNGMFMIHNPYAMCMGGADDMRKAADSLDKVRDQLLGTYVARTKGDSKKISKWMDDETWMTADEAVERGFADSKVEEKAVKAEFPMLEKFAKLPESLKLSADQDMAARQASMNMRAMRVRGASAVNA